MRIRTTNECYTGLRSFDFRSNGMKARGLLNIVLVIGLLSFLSSCQSDENVTPAKEIVNGSTVLIKTNVKIEVGGVLYENVDANLRVTGYNSSDILQWTKEYTFNGPTDNTLEIQNGLDHYSIELVNKWGINDIQSEISAKAIWDGRADGPLPVTYVLGGSKAARKLSRYITSREYNIQGKGIVYQPESRVRYDFSNEGRLQYVHHDLYNSQTLQFEESTTESFLYEGESKNASKIVTTLNGQPYSEYELLYGNTFEHKIKLKENGLIWTQTATRDQNSDRVTVDYNLSNGRSFVYDFNFLDKNIISDKTTQYGELCNQGNYTYDKNINPFYHLGYIDFNFLNSSASNKLTENVDYKACGFPVLMPLLHEYTYDEDGYPLTEIISYRSGYNDNNPVSPYHSKTEFYYE